MNASKQVVHTVFGAGEVGLKLAHELVNRGFAVRLVRRGPAGAARPGLTWMSGDVTDPAFADEAARGAAVVYNCVNPPDYSRWHGVLEPLMRAVRGAATRAGARLVALDCLYMYGAPEAVPFDEDTPIRPRSDKGELRAMLAEEMFEAHRRGEVEVTSGRASDFFGPDTPNSMLLHPRSLTRLRAGKSVEVFGNPDMPHAYSYTPDVARGLAELGTRPEAVGKVFHLPVAWTGTSRALLERCAAALGHQARVSVIPGWALTALGLVSPPMRAIKKMLYQWEQPFVLDDRRFQATFGFGATPIDEAIRTTLGLDRVARQAA
ncbi:NAD-dependent epimerase/dehydratase family protein [Nannocystaceae bacterium ST9]